MAQLIRIEHSQSGTGIFRDSNNIPVPSNYSEDYEIVYPCLSRHNTHFPTPWEEGLSISKDNKNWFCAYKNVNQIQDWIKTNEMEVFIKYGFNILLLEVDDSNLQIGKYQILFTKDAIISATIINTLFV